MYKLKKEDLTKFKDKVLTTVNKVGKRNLAIIASVVLIGFAIYLNFILFYEAPIAQDDGGTSAFESSDSGNNNFTSLDGDGSGSSTESSFAAALISRSRARDEAIEVLQLVVDNPESSEDAVAVAVDEIKKIASDIEVESNIETLVKSKGFDECIAVINGKACSVIVTSAGLLPNELAQIQEIVYEQCGVLPANLKIIEKQA